jgi:hypothetical protein
MTNPASTQPLTRHRHLERQVAIILTGGLCLISFYYSAGFLGLPIERLVDMNPNIRFDDVRHDMLPAHIGTLAFSTLAAFACLGLQLADSRWCVPAMIVYFLTAKVGWVLAAVLINYSGFSVGGFTTVFQVIVLALLFRTHWHKWWQAEI